MATENFNAGGEELKKASSVELEPGSVTAIFRSSGIDHWGEFPPERLA